MGASPHDWRLIIFSYMSKGNMLLGHARGKVGSLVFSRSNGQQVVRARAEVIKNPRTESQMIQRIVLNTVSQAYSKMGVIVDHSFEGIPTGQKSMSYFMKRNMDNVRAKIASMIQDGYDMDSIVAFAPIGTNYFVPNDYEIAKGQLPSVPVSYQGSTHAIVEGIPGNTYGDVISALGLQRGDQLTFITLQGILSSGIDFNFCRVILDPVNGNLTEADLDTPFIVDGAINKPNGRNEGSFNSLSLEGGVLAFNMSAKMMVAAAIIVSRKKADGTWMRSNTIMRVSDYVSSSEYPSLQSCLDALEDGSLDTINARYLNNAGTGVIANQQATVDPVTVSTLTVGGVNAKTGQADITLENSENALAVSIDDAARTGLVAALRQFGGSANIATFPIAEGVASGSMTLTSGQAYNIVILDGTRVLYTSAKFTYTQPPVSVSTITAGDVNIASGQTDKTLASSDPTITCTVAHQGLSELTLALRRDGNTENVEVEDFANGSASIEASLNSDVWYVAVVLDGDEVLYTSARFRYQLSEG